MTLQNKTNQFYNNGHTRQDDDVEDLFEHYGAGDDDTVSDHMSPSTTQTAGNIAMQQDDIVNESTEKIPVETVDFTDASGDVPQSLPIVEEEKKWEAEMENNESSLPLTKDPVAADDSASVQKRTTDTQTQPVASHDAVEMVAEGAAAAAPVRANYNAVVQHAPDMTAKKSYRPEQNSSVTHMQQRIDPSKKTIAIVDDDVDTLEMYATIFENADYNVIRASDGLEALSVFAEHTPHLIFTGIVMPRMDGFAMMEALKQNPRTADIPVVINSHLGRAADKQRAEELGARDFIVRGFTSPREALERIGALLLRSEYVFRFDATDPEARKLVKDLGASSFFVCPRGQEMVIKLSIVDPKELTFSARFSCMDVKK